MAEFKEKRRKNEITEKELSSLSYLCAFIDSASDNAAYLLFSLNTGAGTLSSVLLELIDH
jgi:hypothetical protein